jgi:hypothetical protein
MPKEAVVGIHSASAQLRCGQIYLISIVTQSLPVAQNVSVKTKSGNSPVWIDMEPYVCDGADRLRPSKVALAPGDRDTLGDGEPVHVIAICCRCRRRVIEIGTATMLWTSRKKLLICGVWRPAPFEPRRLWTVAYKKCAVNIHANDYSRCTKLKYCPIVSRNSPSPRLPAIHPLSVVREALGIKDSWLRFKQVFTGSKELVAAAHNSRVQAAIDEVDE